MWVLVRTASARRFYSEPTIYVLSKNKKNINNFQLKIFDLYSSKSLCILHGQVFVMHGRVFVMHGHVFVMHGRVFVMHGRVFVMHGRVFVMAYPFAMRVSSESAVIVISSRSHPSTEI